LKKDIVNANLQLNSYMENVFNNFNCDPVIREAILYSLISNGKNIRSNFLLTVLQAHNLNINDYLPIAASLEMIHTYSLIHDDLPAMDDDATRRGKPTNHLVFGEAIAILAGDALCTQAFFEITKCTALTETQIIKIIQQLTTAAGVNGGMINGQVLDLSGTIENTADLKLLHEQKTGKMFQVIGQITNTILNKTSSLNLEIILAIGFLFQVQDDYLDQFGDELLIGKPVNSDLVQAKKTYLYFMDQVTLKEYIEQLIIDIEKKILKIEDQLEQQYLKDFLNLLLNRQS